MEVSGGGTGSLLGDGNNIGIIGLVLVVSVFDTDDETSKASYAGAVGTEEQHQQRTSLFAFRLQAV